MADGPVLQALTLPTIIDLGANAHLTFSAVASDASSAITLIEFTLDQNYVFSAPYTGPRTGSPTPVSANALYAYSTGSSAPNGLDYFRVAGDHYSAGFTFNVATAPGIYHITGAYLTDAAGNQARYTPDQLATLGAPTALLVKPDSTAPVLSSLSLQVDGVHGQEQTGRITWGATDSGFGVSGILLHFDHALPSGSEYLRIDENDPARFYGWTLTRPAGSAAVSYNLLDVQVTDLAHNSVTYSADQLHAMGFATRLNFGVATDFDFNGDGRADVFWHNANGAVSVWQGGAAGTTTTLIQDTYDSAVGGGWNVADSFDMNGDGKADLLWRHDSGAVSVWMGSATGFQQAAFNDNSMSNAWRIGGAADLDGDGAGDIVWQKNDGSISAWYSTGHDFIKGGYTHGPVGAGWQIAGLADFNGDGKADILWRHADGGVSTWNSTGTSFSENSFYDQVSSTWHVVGIADFNGDGRDDLFWRNDNGAVSVWQGSVSGFIESAYNGSAAVGWNVVQTGDFNGDGVGDVLWRNGTGDTAIWAGGAGGFTAAYLDHSVPTSWSVDSHDFPL